MAEVMINTRFSGVEMPIQQPSSPGSVALCPGLQDYPRQPIAPPWHGRLYRASACCGVCIGLPFRLGDWNPVLGIRQANEHKLLGQRAGQRPMNQTFWGKYASRPVGCLPELLCSSSHQFWGQWKTNQLATFWKFSIVCIVEDHVKPMQTWMITNCQIPVELFCTSHLYTRSKTEKALSAKKNKKTNGGHLPYPSSTTLKCSFWKKKKASSSCNLPCFVLKCFFCL